MKLLLPCCTFALLVVGEANTALRSNNQNAKPVNGRELMQDEDVARREGLRDYFVSRRTGILASTVTSSGQIVDFKNPSCTVIPPPVRQRDLKKSSKSYSADDWDDKAMFEFEEQSAGAPYGTVPFPRRDVVADYLNHGELPHCMYDFLAKYGDPTVHDVNRNLQPYGVGHWEHKFAGAREIAENFGAAGTIAVYKPYVEDNDHRGKELVFVLFLW